MRFLCLAVLLVAAGIVSEAQAEGIKFIRYGVGHAFQPGTTIVAEKLKLSSPEGQQNQNLTDLPRECFSAPGITRVGEFDELDGDNIDRVFRAWSLANIPIEITCGSKTLSVRVFLEASSDGEEWVVFNNPAESTLKYQFWAHLEARFDKVDHMGVSEFDPDDIMRVDRTNGEPEFLFTVTQGLYVAGIPTDNAADQEALISVMTSGGRRVEAVQNPTYAPFITLVVLEEASFENIAHGINTSITRAIEASIAQSKIAMDRLGGELSRKYGPNWDQVLYDRHFRD